MTIQALINKIFRANQTQNNTVSWSGSNGLKSIQEDIVGTIRERTFFTVPTTADLINQGFNNAILCYVQDEAFYRWSATGIPNGTTIFPANDGGVWIQETIGQTSGTVTSVGLSMPAAFTVANSPVTTSGVIGVTGAGTASQYIKGDGTLATFPTIVSGTGTTNYVSKWSNATTLTDGLIYDNGTYTGIGTTNPLARLHIKVPFNNPQRGLLCLETTNAGANPFQSFWSNNTWVGYIDVHQNYFNIQSVTNGLMNLNPSGGNVTVGSVTNAGYKFDVVGSFRATSTTTLSSLSGSGTRMVVADSGGILSTQAVPTGTVTGSGTTNYLPKFTGSTSIGNSLIYDDGTNVGIGTTSPSYKLNVIGESGFQGASAGIDGILNVFRGSSNTYGARIKALDFDGSVSFESLGDNANPNMYFKMRTLGAPITAMTITGGGNVGIGTTSPTTKLDVDGLIRSNRTSNTDGALILGTTGTYLYAADSGGYLASYTANLERLRITSSGNVLIGTTTDAGYKLQVSGIITFRDNDLYYQGFLEATSSNVYLGSLGTQNINLYSGGISYLFINGSNGNVGIGTTSPSGQLDVFSSVYQRLTVTYPSTYVTNLQIGGNAYIEQDAGNEILNIYQGYGSGKIAFLAGGGIERMRIAANGNVGIGTISPNDKLVVSSSSSRVATFTNTTTSQTVYLGSSYQSQYSDLILQVDNGQADIFRAGSSYGSYGGPSSLNIYNDNGPIAFHPNNISNAMFITNSSNVLIGTTTDAGYKLDVNGTGKFSDNLSLTGVTSIGMYLTRGASTNSNAIIWKTSSTFDWFLGSSPLGASTSDLSLYSYGTSSIVLNIARSTGIITLSSLAGTGTRMVVADSAGTLSTQAVPTPTTKSFGAWQHDVTQTAAVNNTGYGVKFDIGDITGHGVVIQPDGLGNNTLIKFVNAGTYNIQFSFQFQNINNQLHDVSIWLRKNGQNTAADVAGSGGFVSIPNSHGGTPGHCIVAWNYFVEANANDYFQLVWSTDSAANVTMEFYPAGSPPPSSASAILTVNQVD